MTRVRRLARLLDSIVVVGAILWTAACAPARSAALAGPDAGGAPCTDEPGPVVTSEPGEVPWVVVSTHAGTTRTQTCDGDGVLRPLLPRVCEPSLDDVCMSGPCRGGGPDKHARGLGRSLVEELGRCLGGRPAFVMAEISRDIVDMNRDAWDPGGPRCALEDPSALPHWEAFHREVEQRVAEASHRTATGALLIDLHTYQSLPAAPPPAIMLGSGAPFGRTLPHVTRDDPGLAVLFGAEGLRARLLNAFVDVDGLRVEPADPAAVTDGLFMGRYVVHRYARLLGTDVDRAGPAIDALQIEVSAGLRDEERGTAKRLADALCSTLGRRLAPPAR